MSSAAMPIWRSSRSAAEAWQPVAEAPGGGGRQQPTHRGAGPGAGAAGDAGSTRPSRCRVVVDSLQFLKVDENGVDPLVSRIKPGPPGIRCPQSLPQLIFVALHTTIWVNF